MFITDAVILQGARTPMARYMGSFDNTSAIELGAAAGSEAVRRAGADPSEFDHVIFGNVMQTSADALYGARHVGLKAGLPIETPAVTVNRLCGSGMESITQAAQRILLGEAKLVLAGGMENMSQCPHVIRGARGISFGRRQARRFADVRPLRHLLRIQHVGDRGKSCCRTWNHAHCFR